LDTPYYMKYIGYILLYMIIYIVDSIEYFLIILFHLKILIYRNRNILILFNYFESDVNNLKHHLFIMGLFYFILFFIIIIIFFFNLE